MWAGTTLVGITYTTFHTEETDTNVHTTRMMISIMTAHILHINPFSSEVDTFGTMNLQFFLSFNFRLRI